MSGEIRKQQRKNGDQKVCPRITRISANESNFSKKKYFITKTLLMPSLPMNLKVLILSAPGLIQGFMELTQRRKDAKTQRRKEKRERTSQT